MHTVHIHPPFIFSATYTHTRWKPSGFLITFEYTVNYILCTNILVPSSFYHFLSGGIYCSSHWHSYQWRTTSASGQLWQICCFYCIHTQVTDHPIFQLHKKLMWLVIEFWGLGEFRWIGRWCLAEFDFNDSTWKKCLSDGYVIALLYL